MRLFIAGLPRVILLFILIVLVRFANAAEANFPPVAMAAANPVEAVTQELVQFSSSGTLDPDNGPAPLGFQWDFGDGAVSRLARLVLSNGSGSGGSFGARVSRKYLNRVKCGIKVSLKM